MNEIDKTKLTDLTKFGLNEIRKMENYFTSEINQRKLCIKKLSKYMAAFDYIEVLIVLSITGSGVCIICICTGVPVGKAGESFTLIFSLTTGILLSITRKKKKKHYKITMLAKSKLNSIETLVSKALIGMEISHEEYMTILSEKDKYEKMKQNVRNVNEKF